MNPRGILASHEMSPVTESIEMSDDGAVVHATQNRGCRNPVTVEMQDGKDRSVTFRVEIVERLPRTTGRTGLGLAVPHDGHDEKIRAIERGADGVKETVTEFPSLVDGSRNMRAHVTGHASGRREFTAEPAESRNVAIHLRADIVVTALEPDVGQNGRPPVARSGNEQCPSPLCPGDSKELNVEEVESGTRPPVSEKPRFDVFRTKRLPEQNVVEKKDLTCGKIVCGTPPERLPGRVTPRWRSGDVHDRPVPLPVVTLSL
jgi:hypothetical protein